jgi:hypothetical protein
LIEEQTNVVSRIHDEMCAKTCKRIKWRTDDDNVCTDGRGCDARDLISDSRFTVWLG